MIHTQQYFYTHKYEKETILKFVSCGRKKDLCHFFFYLEVVFRTRYIYANLHYSSKIPCLALEEQIDKNNNSHFETRTTIHNQTRKNI